MVEAAHVQAPVREARKPATPAVASPQQHNLTAPSIPGISPGSAELLGLQRAVGNRATRTLLRRSLPSTTPGTIVQRRGENPYADSSSHEGWELTAHHVVPHSTLVGQLEALSPQDRRDVLVAAIPDTITDAMLTNLKVAVPSGEAPDVFRVRLRGLLVSDASDDQTVSGIKLGDMRSSFFEWQGGNQFLGPNTSIRPEPSEKKDDIDYDGKYFTSLAPEQFSSLTGLGEELKGTKDPARIKALLLQIIGLTKNSPPRPFDASGWTEVGTIERLRDLLGNALLDRGHLLNYAYFKAALADFGEGKTYTKIKPVLGGEFTYEGLKAPVQVKGTFGYIPIQAAGAVIPKQTESVKLEDRLMALGVTVTKGPTVRVKLEKGVTASTSGKKVTMNVPEASEGVPCIKQEGDTVEIAAKLFEGKKLNKTTDGVSLLEYCEKVALPTSCYLPKALYDEVTAEPLPVVGDGAVPLQNVVQQPVTTGEGAQTGGLVKVGS